MFPQANFTMVSMVSAQMVLQVKVTSVQLERTFRGNLNIKMGHPGCAVCSLHWIPRPACGSACEVRLEGLRWLRFVHSVHRPLWSICRPVRCWDTAVQGREGACAPGSRSVTMCDRAVLFEAPVTLKLKPMGYDRSHFHNTCVVSSTFGFFWVKCFI